MENCNIKISIIMPVYNSGLYLESAVNSILSQNLKDFELILVDDGSTDGSSERCDKFADKDNRIKVIHQNNGGICNARNRALNIAVGEYIAFADHDDEYLPGLLKTAYGEAKKYDADIVKFSKREIILKKQKIIRERNYVLTNDIFNREDIKCSFFTLLERGVFMCVWDGIYRKKMLIDYAIKFDEYFKNGGEDIAFMMQMIKAASTWITISNVYYLHYIRKGFSTSAKFNPHKIDHLKELPNRVIEAINSLNINIDNCKDEYTCYLMKEYINPIIALYCNSNSNLSFKSKKINLKNLLTAQYIPHYFFNRKVTLIWKKSKKNGVAYFFIKYRMYYLLLLMHTFRLKYMQ